MVPPLRLNKSCPPDMVRLCISSEPPFGSPWIAPELRTTGPFVWPNWPVSVPPLIVVVFVGPLS